MTMGAKTLPIFDVPKGWIKKRRMRIAQVVPTIVDSVIFGCTTSRLYPLSNVAMYIVDCMARPTLVLHQEQIVQA